ncbi:hypothetical protein SAMN04487894_1242 [Niabella drilacis]|uniref:Uncharacterized protein n=1 Tax=Niabella drilacis (strain DSM 25811 / CCM 8410 / CCUG 62505 / LMG 26954 / E90) TaxID=1285928 RepID=A0A1G7AKP5_NIADE|nr:hypothetical protein SAMN04487894_1242 [Niabella drilacis]
MRKFEMHPTGSRNSFSAIFDYGGFGSKLTLRQAQPGMWRALLIAAREPDNLNNVIMSNVLPVLSNKSLTKNSVNLYNTFFDKR